MTHRTLTWPHLPSTVGHVANLEILSLVRMNAAAQQ